MLSQCVLGSPFQSYAPKRALGPEATQEVALYPGSLKKWEELERRKRGPVSRDQRLAQCPTTIWPLHITMMLCDQLTGLGKSP